MERSKRARRPSSAARAAEEQPDFEDEEEDFFEEDEKEEEEDEEDDFVFSSDSAKKEKKKKRSKSAHAARSKDEEEAPNRRRASSAEPPSKRGRNKKHKVEPHPASVPVLDRCFLADNNFVNNDVKRMICSYLDRQSITALSLTCKAFRHAIMGSALKAFVIPTVSRPNSKCPFCSRRRSRNLNRSYTCEFGHEIHVHHSCFKAQVLRWDRDLSLARCCVGGCGGQIVEYGKEASAYKGNRRQGILSALFKTVGRSSHSLLFRRGFVYMNREECCIQ